MRRRRLAALFFGLALILALALLKAADPYPVRMARETSFDLFQQVRPRAAPTDMPIRIVDIDEASLAALGQWPWPRALLADLARRLDELGAAAVAFDILFSEPDRLSSPERGDQDSELAAALASGPTILSLARNAGADETGLEPKAGVAATGADPLAGLPALGGVVQPLPSLAAAAKGLGIASLDDGGAGVARRLPLLWRSGDHAFPALSVEALRVAMDAPTLVVLGDNTGAAAVEGLRIGDVAVPTGPHGAIWLYYRNLEPELYISARALLADDYARLAPMIAGHVVFVGSSASGLHDIRMSALGVPVPGVSIHVQALEQMLTGTYLDRADWVGGLELALFVLSGCIIVLAAIFTGPFVGLVISLAVMLAQIAMAWWAFSGPGLLIDPSYGFLFTFVLYAAMAFFRFAVTDADRRRIRRAFAHYVEPSLLPRLEADGSLLRLGGDLRDITVMFSDIRNFSALAERTEPAELMGLLNRLFAALGTAIIRHMGTIDKFMGDAVMAFWNAPVDVEQHAHAACRAALDMRAALDGLNAGGGEPIAIGIGIATGPALVGNMGFEQRFDYSCVGDTVNVASRVEGACRRVGYDIVVTGAVAAAAPDLATLPAGRVNLRNMSGVEPIHILLGDAAMRASPAFAVLAAAHADLLATLAEGRVDPDLLHICIERSHALDGRLAAFYAACPDRIADFAPDPSGSVSVKTQVHGPSV